MVVCLYYILNSARGVLQLQLQLQLPSGPRRYRNSKEQVRVEEIRVQGCERKGQINEQQTS